MTYNITVNCPDCVSMIDANDLFRYLILAIQDLEIDIADKQHVISSMTCPFGDEQLQMYAKVSYLPELIENPALGAFLAFNDISIDEWQERIDKHMSDLKDYVNGDDVIATNIV